MTVSANGLGDAGRRRQGARELLGARGLERRHVRERVAVEEAVVAPLPLHDLVLAGVGAREADGRLRRLGAGVGEAHLVDARHGLHDLAADLVVKTSAIVLECRGVVTCRCRQQAPNGPALSIS